MGKDGNVVFSEVYVKICTALDFTMDDITDMYRASKVLLIAHLIL